MWCWLTAIALCGNDDFDASLGDLLANDICIVALVGEERLDPVGNHPEQRRKTLAIMGLPGCQDEAERAAFRIASGMELGGEAAARSAKRLGRLSPLFMPTAQW